ncbi:MAG: hypothetical protein EXS09_21365 [Gemmataceae bacterium]|nr:hypothetical protein [Gemmataceae bacterium]
MPVNTREDVDDSLAVLIAAGRSHVDAAETCDISVRTVQRRLDDPEFRTKVDRLKRQSVSRAIGTLCQSMNTAATTLATLVVDGVDEKTRLQAAKEIISAALKSRAQEELEGAIADLMERLVAVEERKERRR